MKMAKEKTSRLGTGLSALFGEEENVLENETVQTLPILAGRAAQGSAAPGV